ncbi:doublecortin domain-containing protein 2C, partial [Sorex araneus]|uniref:doublecortin domain-containing protein 2C n=1 Tax=Sorex araneus TaxID=42254 RepID=UPI0024336878
GSDQPLGTRKSYSLVDTTPAKTILVYRNGDQFYVGKKFVLSRRRVATFEVLLEQLTQQVEVPFGVRRLYTPTRGRRVLELESLRSGGKYVAAGRERFKKLDYINIATRKPPNMKKLKEIKPVVHSDINVPSKWQSYQRLSRHINVFTNGKLRIPPVKIIIPRFTMQDWSNVLGTVGEKVFPSGGVRRLFTLTGNLLDNSQELQDNQFYVAAGLDSFKHFSYWKSPKVPKEVQEEYADIYKYRRKKKEENKEKEAYKLDKITSKAHGSVYYAKETNKRTQIQPLLKSAAESNVYEAKTPNLETQGAQEVKDDKNLQVEVPVDQKPSEMVIEEEIIEQPSSAYKIPSAIVIEDTGINDQTNSEDNKTPSESIIENSEIKEQSISVDSKTPSEIIREYSWISGQSFTEDKTLSETIAEDTGINDQSSSEDNKTTSEIITEDEGISSQSGLEDSKEEDKKSCEDDERKVCIKKFCSFVFPTLQRDLTRQWMDYSLVRNSRKNRISRRTISGTAIKRNITRTTRRSSQESLEHQPLPSVQASQEQISDEEEASEEVSLGQSSQERVLAIIVSVEQSSMGQLPQEQMSDTEESLEQSSMGESSPEQVPDIEEPPELSSMSQLSQEQIPDTEESLQLSSMRQSPQEQIPDNK